MHFLSRRPFERKVVILRLFLSLERRKRIKPKGEHRLVFLNQHLIIVRQLTIYQINLKGHETNEHSLGVPYLMNSRKIERRAVFYYTQISGSIVAAAIVNLVNQPPHQILLYNIQTDATIIMDSPILSVRLFVCFKTFLMPVRHSKHRECYSNYTLRTS